MPVTPPSCDPFAGLVSPGLSTPAVDTAERLRTVFTHIRRAADERISRDGLSLARLRTLSVLAADGPMRARAIADAIDCAAASVTDMVDGLARDGLADRQPDPTDRRATLISITPAGRAALARGKAQKAQVLEDVFSTLSPDERAHLDDLLERLLAHIATTPILDGVPA